MKANILAVGVFGVCATACALSAAAIPSESIRIRDPFVLADAKSQTYYLYGAEHYIGEKCEQTGVVVRKSRNLKDWSEPVRVMTAPKGIQCVWAPEVHAYGGAYYMFATLKEYPDANHPLVMMGPTPDWSSNMRGSWASWHAVWIFRADRPEGPFVPVSGRPITPPGWIALDGTLAVEDGKPYLVFTHDWAQVADGTVELAPLTDDLTALAAPPKTIFRASTLAPGTLRGVTDGPFVYRSPKSGKLFITWSTHNPAKLKMKKPGYCVASSESATGRLEGPWINHRIIFDENGGHGMIFRTPDGSPKFILHNPERWGDERLAIYDFKDDGENIGIGRPHGVHSAESGAGAGIRVSCGSHTVCLDERRKGAVTGLVTRAGVSFMAASARPLFSVQLRQTEALTNCVSVDSASARSFSHRPFGEDGVELVYSNFQKAVSSVRCTVRGDAATGRVRWRIAVRPQAGWAVCETTYPQLALTPQIGASDEDDAILTGRSSTDGLKRRPWAKKFGVYANQPHYLAVQMACYYDPNALLLFACEDGQGEAKRLHGWSDGKKACGIALSWCHLGWNTDGAEVPYDVVTATLDGTDLTWHDGADLYRTWAERQRWCRTPWARRTDIPAWLKGYPAYADMGLHWRSWVDRPGLLNRWAKDYWKTHYPNGKLAFHFDGWERGGVYIMTDYFPLYPTTEAYAALAADLMAHDVLPFPWPSGYRRSDAFNRRADGTFEIDEREAFARDFAPHACTRPDGAVTYLASSWLLGGRVAYMCGGDPWTLNWFTEDICGRLARCHTPLVSGDQNIGGCFDACWNRRHGHAPGWGRWMTDSIRRQIPLALNALRRASDDAAFCYEEPNEQINDLVTFNNVRESYTPKEEWAGIFNYLYHEYAPNYPLSRTDRYTRAYNLAMGLMPRVVMEVGDVDREAPYLPNGGFEELDRDGVTCRFWENGKAQRPNGLDSSVAHSGRRSMRVEQPPGTNRWTHVAMSMPSRDDALTPGRKYRLGAWLKVARGSLRLDFGIFGDGKSLGWAALCSEKKDVGGDWRHVTAEFTCPEGERALVRFMANATRGTLGWFDDVTLEEQTADGRFAPLHLKGSAEKTRLEREWIDLYGGEGRPYLAYGRRVKPPVVTCASMNFAGRTVQTVVCGAYLSPSGEKAWVVANGSPAVQSASWREDGRDYAVTLRPDEAKIVKKTTGR